MTELLNRSTINLLPWGKVKTSLVNLRYTQLMMPNGSLLHLKTLLTVLNKHNQTVCCPPQCSLDRHQVDVISAWSLLRFCLKHYMLCALLFSVGEYYTFSHHQDDNKPLISMRKAILPTICYMRIRHQTSWRLLSHAWWMYNGCMWQCDIHLLNKTDCKSIGYNKNESNI